MADPAIMLRLLIIYIFVILISLYREFGSQRSIGIGVLLLIVCCALREDIQTHIYRSLIAFSAVLVGIIAAESAVLFTEISEDFPLSRFFTSIAVYTAMTLVFVEVVLGIRTMWLTLLAIRQAEAAAARRRVALRIYLQMLDYVSQHEHDEGYESPTGPLERATYSSSSSDSEA